MRCPVCRAALTRSDPDAPWRCVPCATIVRRIDDPNGRILLGYNRAGKLCFQARANYRLDDYGPSRAHAGYDAPLDAWTAPALGGAQVKPRTP